MAVNLHFYFWVDKTEIAPQIAVLVCFLFSFESYFKCIFQDHISDQSFLVCGLVLLFDEQNTMETTLQ